ncbi:hypothetical protein CCUS01_11700 [Colletotrichum cuscutae]|uniref:Uncharacterized protein n=1 Tax=Colletotrichum cuscutae TaxID=1209917 RepID=A0AAI9XHY4_9PEZI|nr:hypothetical protein CCUS01_11700 [Colletotrichum cuscutae]
MRAGLLLPRTRAWTIFAVMVSHVSCYFWKLLLRVGCCLFSLLRRLEKRASLTVVFGDITTCWCNLLDLRW